ncbi:unnamed protein product [Auanema sp. JU1783]|nr:unnamed protein product [Auanema sp. JU1783]
MIWFFLISIIHITLAEYCTQADYSFEFTECNNRGQRWRVAVPRDGHTCDNLPPPQTGINCSFSCAPGNYLDVVTQECRPCSPGSYSLGGGIRFEEFVDLPHGFSIENFDTESDILSDSTVSVQPQKCPPETGWILKDGELMYIPSLCISRLSFSATLVRPGYAEFGFRLPKHNREAFSLQVEARNQQCQSYNEAFQSMMNKYTSKSSPTNDQTTSNGDWRRRRIELRSGPNVISWTVSFRSNGYQKITEPLRISHIDVVGLAFTRECTSCPSGTYSDYGAAECKPCSPGYYSTKGSSSCGRCPESQYSGPKAEKCVDRPPCRLNDYYPVTEPCLNGTTKTNYQKVQPEICREDFPSSVKTPPTTPSRTCPKCNPGMAKDAQGKCKFCKAGFFSDGNECKECMADTMPNYGYQFTQWEEMPPHITSRCEYINEEVFPGCNVSDAWLPSGSMLISAPSLEKGIALELIVDVPEGFNEPAHSPSDFLALRSPISQFTVVFETTCADSSCVLYFFEDSSANRRTDSYTKLLAAFNGTQPERVWSLAITKPNPTRFLVAFVRSGAPMGNDNPLDSARIISISLTNVGKKNEVQGGGATECLPCPKGKQNGRCIPCPSGHFMDPSKHICVSCPENTIVNASYSNGGDVCIKCGTNLKSSDRISCSTDGHLVVQQANKSLNYDFSQWLNKTFVVHGVKVFAREGISYYHSFNFTIFNKATVQCAVAFDGIIPVYDQINESVEGAACRLTVLPETTGNKTSVAYVSPLLLANRLAEISTRKERDGWKLTNQLLEYDDADNSSRPLDAHFWFEAVGGAMEVCPRGNLLVVTIRCSPTHKTPNIRLPRTCPDGTCDGCLFHIIIESAQGCPVCGSGSYQRIKGECVNGKQTIHFIPEKHCVLSGKEAESHEEECSVLSKFEKFLMAFGIVLLIIMSVTLVRIYKRNRRLEYRYTRLIESRNGELPAAETCGIEDEEEEEEDRVMFSKGKRKLFGSNRLGKTDGDRKSFAYSPYYSSYGYGYPSTYSSYGYPSYGYGNYYGYGLGSYGYYGKREAGFGPAAPAN